MALRAGGWFVTGTGEETAAHPNPSFRNMIRAGFRLAYHRDNFMTAAAARQSSSATEQDEH